MKSSNKLKKEDILYLAKLANLKLTEEEINKFLPQITDIVSYFNKLNSIKTEKVKPIAQLTELVNSFREDIVTETRTLTQEEAVKNAKSKKDGLFKVKAIF